MDPALEVRAHGALWGLPVAESDAVVLRVSSEVDDDAQEQQTDQCDDLDTAEPELKLAEYPDAEEVHSEDYENDQYPSGKSKMEDLVLNTMKITADRRRQREAENAQLW